MYKYLLILLISTNCFADSLNIYCYDKCNSKGQDYFITHTGNCYCTIKLSDRQLEETEPLSQDDMDFIQDLKEDTYHSYKISIGSEDYEEFDY